MKQKLTIKSSIDNSTIISGDVSTSLQTEIDQNKTNKTSKDKEYLNPINHFDSVSIYKLLYSTMIKYMFFSSVHSMFTIKINYMLGLLKF